MTAFLDELRKCNLLGGVREHATQEIFFRFQFPKVPFPEFLSHSDKIFTDSPNHFPDFNLESFGFLPKTYMKNLTDFRKTVENCMDPRLILISKTGHQKNPFTFKELEFKKFYHGYF